MIKRLLGYFKNTGISKTTSGDELLGIRKLKLIQIYRIALIAIVLPAIIYYFNFSALGLSKDTAVWGQFGDYFNGLTGPFLSFLGLIAILLTLHETRKEADEAKTIADQQMKTLELQRFETTFFNMMSLLHETIKSFEIDKPQTDYEFNPAILVSETHKYVLRISGRDVLSENISTYLKVSEHEKILEPFNDTINTYIKNILIISKFIHDGISKESDKAIYYSILKSQMTMVDKALIVILIKLFTETNLKALSILDLEIDEGWELFVGIITNNLSNYQINLKCPTL